MCTSAIKETQTMTNNTPNNQTPSIPSMPLTSKNPVDVRLQALKQLLPEAFSESGIDFEKLRLLLGDAVEDDDQERYAFTWPGKADAIRASQVPSA